MATQTTEVAVCSQCDPEDPSGTLGECIVCGDLTCEWHGKEYNAMAFSGIAHHACRDYGWED